MASNAVGRPTMLTEEVYKTILAVVGMGNFRCVAAKVAGVSPETVKHWVMRGKREEGTIYAQFAHALTVAEASVEAKAVHAIVTAGIEEDPSHAKWYLERKFAKRWAKRPPKAEPAQAPASALVGAVGDSPEGQDSQGPTGPTPAGPRSGADLFARIDSLAEEFEAAAEREVQEEMAEEAKRGDSQGGGV